MTCLAETSGKQAAPGTTQRSVLLAYRTETLGQNIALGSSREPPVCPEVFRWLSRFSGPGLPHDEKSRGDGASVKAAPLQGAGRFGLATCRAVGLAKAEARQRSG